MIPAVHPRGSNVGGLLRYLFGPGKREEHLHPRVVAAWDGADPLPNLQPPRLPGGGPDVRRLTQLLEQPVRIGFRPPAKTVWHCSIRTHPTDRTLSDGQWAHIAAEVIAAVELAPHGDLDAVRWLAVRHNDDHVHLVATLVRQDRRTAWPWQDKRKAQAACRDLEERYGVYRVAVAGPGARRWPGAAELNKAARLAGGSKRTAGTHRVVAPREQLRRQVRETAAIAADEHEFFARLTAAGAQVRLRRSSRDADEVTGYAVGLPGHRTATGEVVWYGGGRLAADLTLPQLRSRWTGTPPPMGGNAARIAAAASFPLNVSRRAAETVRDATTVIAASPSPAVASAIAYAAADLLTATAQAWEGRSGGPLTEAAEWLDRAAHELRGRISARRVSQAGHLRAMARLVAKTSTASRDEDATAATQLVYTLAAFAENLADLCEAVDRLQQTRAAREAAGRLRAYVPQSGLTGARVAGTRHAWHREPERSSRQQRGQHR
ncbi:relaxase/mobilization nuclease domain-containing protein [Phytohabitans kaempferiae]|uniref:Relaxase/mobilization nuclease domain-containing protein n=1 Tax=Phytohabitans kaempferiae TaxID=1620943 RepID=A0ABV6M811_9ACTN